MNIISIDLGTTNIKAAAYDNQLHMLALLSEPVFYNRKNEFVEFDPQEYFHKILRLINRTAAAAIRKNKKQTAQIVLTGQAESLIILDSLGDPICPGISWMDNRSYHEAKELSQTFSFSDRYKITGQPEMMPTWPITKILWLKRNHPDILNSATHILLLKDYILKRLSGNALGDYSIYGFSHYFHLTKKTYWTEILDYCGVKETQLPPLAPSGSIAGYLLPAYQNKDLGLTDQTKINIGTLDHFAGMIGSGNIHEGWISESAGTVLSLAAYSKEPILNDKKIPNYCGPFADSYVLLPVCDSGGLSMEWFKQNFLSDISYEELNRILSARSLEKLPLFLPYLTGVNPPEYNESASGVFFGLNVSHDKFDMALAVMQGVACLLKKNLEALSQSGIEISKIISSGGGARSSLWTQIKADISRCTIFVPQNTEAACLGAAVMAAVSEGFFSSYQHASEACASPQSEYTPGNKTYESVYSLFCKIFNALSECYSFNHMRMQKPDEG